MKWPLCCSCVSLFALLARSSSITIPPIISTRPQASEARVCVIIRTYWKHGEGSPGSLQSLIQSLKSQTHTRWDAQFVIMDSTPFENVTDIINGFEDDRLWIYAHMIGSEYSPKKDDGTWQPEYHTKLYDLTDQAARACHTDTEWVIFTNGDNMYHSHAFEEIVKATRADAVALDFYSRYSRPTGIPCERFKVEGAAPRCKRNRMRWCHTDLGAVAYRWRKLVEEDLRFAPLKAPHRFTSQDALMAELVVEKQWKVTPMEDKCLYDQGPNPVSCAVRGDTFAGIWDDTSSWLPSDFGGHCILDKSANEYEDSKDVEVVTVSLAHDSSLSGFPVEVAPGVDLANLTISCLRPTHNHRFAMLKAFGEECMEDVDAPLFAEYMRGV